MEEPIKKRRGRPKKADIEQKEVDFKSLFRKPKADANAPKTPRTPRAPRQKKILLESEKKINCGFTDKNPDKWRNGTEEECQAKRQWRLYGLNKISGEAVEKAKKGKETENKELERTKLQAQIAKNNIQIKSRLKKVEDADPQTKERLKAEIAQLKQQNAELKAKL